MECGRGAPAVRPVRLPGADLGIAGLRRAVLAASCHAIRMAPAPIKPLIDPQLLEQLDVRVGTIESVADVPGSQKLVQLRVSFGDHARTILAGMKLERTNPREMEG